MKSSLFNLNLLQRVDLHGETLGHVIQLSLKVRNAQKFKFEESRQALPTFDIILTS